MQMLDYVSSFQMCLLAKGASDLEWAQVVDREIHLKEAFTNH
jgi:hypothetical protein